MGPDLLATVPYRIEITRSYRKIVILSVSVSEIVLQLLYSASTKGLVTNYGEGGATKREGGHVKFYPYKKGGRKKF